MNFTNYNLVDSRSERRLESWGDVLVDRPAPQAQWSRGKKCDDWSKAMVRFDKKKGKWDARGDLPEHWFFEFGKVRANLRLSVNGQVGVFPEQMENWKWIHEKLSDIEKPVRVLNLFAYTGMSTLVASASSENVEVWHVDVGKSFVNWARDNARVSGLDKNKIHWIVEDVIKFLEREVRRGHKYDAIILDPPAFGRAGSRVWKITKDLSGLMNLLGQVLVDCPEFVCFSWHDSGLPFGVAEHMLSGLSQFEDRQFEKLDLIIPATKGIDLPAGKCVRG